MKLWKKIVYGFIALIVLISSAFAIWGETPAKAMPEALAALQSDSQVIVTTGSWLVFQPADGKYQTGFVFYPGGRVDYRAYAPMAHAIAAKGYLVVIPHMPLNLAVFGIEKVSEVIAAHKEVQHWVIGGHSLGGSMAAHSLYQHPDSFAGLVLLASYPASSDDLSSYAGKVLSLSGSLDGLATPAKIEASKALLPVNTRFLQLQGGNHAYFGWYGNQSADNTATISREEQQKIVDEEIISLLSQVSK